NPIREVWRSFDASSAILNPSNNDDLQWLYAAAVHECTHMADGITYHDESFAAAMTRNVARTSGKEKQVRAIKRLVSEQERGEPQQESRGPSRPKRLTYDERADVDERREENTLRSYRTTMTPFALFVAVDEQGNETTTDNVIDYMKTYVGATALADEIAKRDGVDVEVRDAHQPGRRREGGAVSYIAEAPR
ncbi:MAG TPA: hypothetical protein VFH61_13755, partial [Thermoleophilia bacterium]|nr:hypothetical protein [Thermoleophilia bacterium]